MIYKYIYFQQGVIQNYQTLIYRIWMQWILLIIFHNNKFNTINKLQCNIINNSNNNLLHLQTYNYNNHNKYFNLHNNRSIFPLTQLQLPFIKSIIKCKLHSKFHWISSNQFKIHNNNKMGHQLFLISNLIINHHWVFLSNSNINNKTLYHRWKKYKAKMIIHFIQNLWMWIDHHNNNNKVNIVIINIHKDPAFLPQISYIKMLNNCIRILCKLIYEIIKNSHFLWGIQKKCYQLIEKWIVQW